MFRRGSISWKVAFDFPKELLFLGYVAQAEQFRVPEEAEPASDGEGQWQAWWQILPMQTFGVISREAHEASPGLDTMTTLRMIAARRQSVFDPPDFSALQDKPTLRELCRRHWPAYHREWETMGGAGAEQMKSWHERFHHLHIDRIVGQCARATGKAVFPFSLMYDFLLWPQEYYRKLSDTHFLLGSTYLEHDERLKALLHSTIAQLLMEQN